jgi:integrase/recombinase XerD
MNYNVYPYLDKRSTGKDGKHTIKIAIAYDRKADYVNTEVYATPEEWLQLLSDKVPKHLKDAKNKMQSTEGNVRLLLASMVNYDIKVLRMNIAGLNKPVMNPSLPRTTMLPTDVFHWFDLKIKELEEPKEAYGTADNYRDTKRFYIKYTGQSSVEFSHFTKDELYRIQKKVVSAGMAAGNVYRHARQLRAIFNMALFEQAIDKSIYPFHKRGYIIPQTTKRKKSLSRDNVGALINFNPVIKEERRALDYFIFSFFGNGMNIKDVAYLRHSDIHGNAFRFVRKKTENTNTQPKEIKVAITPEMWQVIERQGNASKDGFVFPIINEKDEAVKQRKDYKNLNRSVNIHLKNICKQLEFTKPVTHGISRYTYANALKQMGIPITYISESMGHSSTAVTEHYLNSFEDDIVIQHAEKLREYGVKPATPQ